MFKTKYLEYLNHILKTSSKNYKRMLTVLGGFVSLLILYIFFFSSTEKVEYLTEVVRWGNIEQRVTATGKVNAVQLVDVGAQVSGQIEKLHVKQGQKVKKGDMVAEIDSTTQENELETNKARLETYKAQLNSRQIALKIAQTKYKRERNLKAKDATSSDKLEDAQNELAAAEAAVTEMESLIRQTQIAVSTSEVNLGYTKISAPLDGVIVSLPVEEGQTLNANQTTPTIVQIGDLSEMEIKIEISEGDVTKLQTGMKVSFTILSEPDNVYKTTLKSIDPGLTTLTDGTYTETTDETKAIYYYGNLVVPNAEGKLRIGMTTQSIIIIGSVKDTLIVPSMSIYYEDEQAFVDVLEEGDKVMPRKLEIGLSDNMNTQVISGLEEGEVVILAMMSESDSSSNTKTSRMRI